ncbi:MAG: hypothetical protein CMF62_03690 [Magnetococcales bacterium]|nr:hypothetical protein [Magnetococcales bacterium]|tara:strand:- start:8457 stop:8846 length:390 start_codon:yes stop_codon:yes gene_type:complete
MDTIFFVVFLVLVYILNGFDTVSEEESATTTEKESVTGSETDHVKPCEKEPVTASQNSIPIDRIPELKILQAEFKTKFVNHTGLTLEEFETAISSYHDLSLLLGYRQPNPTSKRDQRLRWFKFIKLDPM